MEHRPSHIASAVPCPHCGGKACDGCGSCPGFQKPSEPRDDIRQRYRACPSPCRCGARCDPAALPLGHRCRAQGRCNPGHAGGPRRRGSDAPHPHRRGAARHRDRRGVRHEPRQHLAQLDTRSDRRHLRIPGRAADLRHADRARRRGLAGARDHRPADPRRTLDRSAWPADGAQRSAGAHARLPDPGRCDDRNHRARITSTSTTATTSWRWPRRPITAGW